jgi:hypothetical protein
MPGTIKTVAWIRLPNDLFAPNNVDTELFKFPASLDPGPRLVRLSVTGSIIQDTTNTGISINASIKALGLIVPVPNFGKVQGLNSIFSPSGSIEIVASILGGHQELVVLFTPYPSPPPGASPDYTLCGVNGTESKYAWQAVLEDLGSST